MTENVEDPVLPEADLRGVSVGHEVREYVRRLIMSGTLRAGDRLRVEHLAAQLRISVTPVREALVELLGEGFVERRPRRGYVVAKLTRSGFEDRVLVLAMVSGELASRAAKSIDTTTLSSLKALQKELTRLDREGERDAADDVNYRLHSAINRAAQSPELAWTAERFARYVPRSLGGPPNTRPRSCSYRHAPIIAALESGDADSARTATFEHLVEASRSLGDDLARAGLWAQD